MSTDSLLSMVRDVERAYKNGRISVISIHGSTSPEGSSTYNNALSRKRAVAMRDYIITRSDIPASLFEIVAIGENWSALEENIDKCLTSDQASEVRSVISEYADLDMREAKLRKPENAGIWSVMSSRLFPVLRRSVIEVRFKDGGEQVYAVDEQGEVTEILSPAPEPEAEHETQPEPVPEIVGEPEAVPADKPQDCEKLWRVYTNIPAWGMAIANAGGEYDFSCHWSANLSIYYSAWNYGTETRKFRTFIFRPEVRRWLHTDHHGFFVDAHLQMAAYNYSHPSGQYRIQDVGGKNPALGGGIGVGYRINVPWKGKPGDWSFEAQLGCGVYHLYYDRFENRANGQLIDTRSRTWFGIDNAAVSVVYTFNKNKK